ncbi:hypothetical protein PM082_004393 [Marasmius tenuissimus]|nr:hypothetical protein PM082_004393 [Marasmius tenuissimus]
MYINSTSLLHPGWLMTLKPRRKLDYTCVRPDPQLGLGCGSCMDERVVWITAIYLVQQYLPLFDTMGIVLYREIYRSSQAHALILTSLLRQTSSKKV